MFDTEKSNLIAGFTALVRFNMIRYIVR